MIAKYGQLMLPGAFPDKETPDIDFNYEEVVRCDSQLKRCFFR